MRRPGGNFSRISRVLVAHTIESVAVLITLASLVFFALRVLPGDPARLVLGDEASELDLSRVRATLHLDEPLPVQYMRFLRGLASFDLGDSLRRPGVRAMTRVSEALLPTAQLAAVAVAVGATAGVVAAVVASGPWLWPRARLSLERGLVAAAAVPLARDDWVMVHDAARPCILTELIEQFLDEIGDDPVGGLLAVPLAAHVGRIARAALADAARGPFLTVASAKGAGAARVWVVHALPTVIGPIITVVAAQLGALLGGAVVLERMFERAGLGTLILEAYATRDLPVLEGAVVAAGLLFVVAQALGTAAHLAIDPRARGSW